MDLIFMGTPQFAADHLKTLIDHPDHQVLGVYTQPDRPKGRSKKTLPSPVKELAQKHNIPVYQPINLKRDEDLAPMREKKPHALIVVAYGLFLPQKLLEIPEYGGINIHASLLPQFRGAAPIHYALLKGEKKTGVTSILMNQQMDAGNILLQEETPVSADDDIITLNEKLSQLGQKCLLKTLDKINESHFQWKGIVQEHELATFAPKIKKNDSLISEQDKAHEIHQKIKAFHLWPGCKVNLPLEGEGLLTCKINKTEVIPTTISGLEPFHIYQQDKKTLYIQTCDGILSLQEIQPLGKKSMNTKAFLNGHNIKNHGKVTL